MTSRRACGLRQRLELGERQAPLRVDVQRVHEPRLRGQLPADGDGADVDRIDRRDWQRLRVPEQNILQRGFVDASLGSRNAQRNPAQHFLRHLPSPRGRRIRSPYASFIVCMSVEAIPPELNLWQAPAVATLPDATRLTGLFPEPGHRNLVA